MKKFVLSLLLSIAFFSAGCADYVLKTGAEPKTVPAGGSGKIIIKMKAGGKYHLDPNGLYMANFEAPGWVTLEKKALRTEDLGKDFTFTAPFKIAPTAARGQTQIRAKVMFQLCAESFCRLINEERTIALTIQ